LARRYVIDANATLGLFLRLPYSEQAELWMRERQAEEARLVVPTLWEYECLTGFRRAVTFGLISMNEAADLMEKLYALEFQRIPPTQALHQAALRWAERIGQSKAHDAHYLAVAETLSAEFWTADVKLVHASMGLGVTWIHSILTHSS
jgi:predicted nucleic acid-binding protein